MKEQIKKLLDARQRWIAAQAEFEKASADAKDALTGRTCEAEIQSRIERYMKAEDISGKGHGHPFSWGHLPWKIDETSIHGEWEETWSRGGHESCWFSVPLEMFFDDGQALAAYEAQQNKIKADAKAVQDAAEESAERAKFEQLKQKFEAAGAQGRGE